MHCAIADSGNKKNRDVSSHVHQYTLRNGKALQAPRKHPSWPHSRGGGRERERERERGGGGDDGSGSWEKHNPGGH